METTVEPRTQKRLALVAWASLFWGGVLVFRLIQLQVVDHPTLRQQAQKQQEHMVEVPAARGTLYSGGEGGGPLAISVPVKRVVMNPLRIPEEGTAFVVAVIEQMLGVDGAALSKEIAAARSTRKGYLILREDATAEEITRLRRSKLDVFTFEDSYRREYPKGQLAAHVVGWVNHDGHGDAGVERGLEEELRGVPGKMRMQRDARNRDYYGEIVNQEKPEPGVSIRLTIDEAIQQAAERALLEAVLKEKVPSGTIVALNPKTGDILALASYPFYDPREKVHGEADMLRRMNLTIAAPFEPGSVFKAVTAAAALETTRLRPDTIIHCGNGVIRLAGRVIHDHDPYSSLPMTMVIAKSSNIGAINMGLAVGNENMHSYLAKFGFGERVGLPLPGESGGQVHAVRDWSPSSMGSIAMGHEFMATPLQLAQAFGIIANNGMLVKPRIVKARQRPGHSMEPVAVERGDQRIKPETAIELRRMLEQTVLAGTGKTARIKGYTVGGKTGTAQMVDPRTGKYIHRYNSSFVGFAPVADPAIVVAVTLNASPKYGGVTAAPVFAEVVSAALRTLGVPKDLPEQEMPTAKPAAPAAEEPPRAPLQVAEAQAPPLIIEGPVVPDFAGMTMRGVMEKSAAQGLHVTPVGRGIARAQMPPAGSAMPSAKRIRVVFRP